jgi:flagellar biosynthesis protein FlhG
MKVKDNNMQEQIANSYRPSKVLAITGGKGGIGKTNIAINLSVALAGMSQNVVLLDADMGLANIDVMLGIKAKNNLSDVLSGQCKLEEIIITGPNNINIIPSSSGNIHMASLGYKEIGGLIDTLSSLENKPNYLIIDTAAGITESVVGFAAAADEIIVVVCNEPSSIADAYALIKLLNKQFNIHKFRVITNKMKKVGENDEVFAKLTRVTDKFLNISIVNLGSIPEDKFMEKSVRKSKSVVTEYPYSLGTKAFYDIARNIMNLPIVNTVTGNMQFFQKQLVEG